MSCDELKTLGNDCFVKGNYEEAERYYTEALDHFCENRAVLLTNRSAARLHLGKLPEALEDSQQAIDVDPTWTKAYYRKCMALEKMGNHERDCYLTSLAAYRNCEKNTWLQKQMETATAKWISQFRSVPVVSTEDLMSRFQLLTDSRERLSTMAHFWNESSQEDRLHHFRYLLTLIGGEGELSEKNREISADMMIAMPLHNYEDLTRDRIVSWIEHFSSLPVEEKTQLFRHIWDNLVQAEKDLVISDLHVFISQAYEMVNNPPKPQDHEEA